MSEFTIQRRYSKPGEGSTRTHAKGVRRIVVSFDDETFSDIRTRAEASQQSFASIVRELVEWGMMELQPDVAAPAAHSPVIGGESSRDEPLNPSETNHG